MTSGSIPTTVLIPASRPGLASRFRAWPRAFLAVVLLIGGSCSSYSNYVFAPSVHDVEVRDPSEELLARVLIAPRGIAEGDKDSGGRIEMRFRVRIENRSDERIALVPSELELMDANLESFGEPLVRQAAGTPEAQAGTENVYVLHFPFPPGQTPSSMDLRSLRLRLGLSHADELLLPTAVFERVYRYPDPYYYPDVRWSIGIGYGVCY